MTLEDRIKTGRLYVEFGNETETDKAYEKVLEEQRNHCKEVMFDFNHSRPSESAKRLEILKSLLAEIGTEIWIEPPAYFAYGCNTHIGNHFYANFNLVIVDDGEVYIGNNVMLAPNVTISVTGHPICPELRRKGTQFSLPIHIEDGVWIGANVVLLPGVTIGQNAVIGAGSVVTHDIPADTVAFGVPCRPVRKIDAYDREFYRKGMRIE